jgi:hypothetical protein
LSVWDRAPLAGRPVPREVAERAPVPLGQRASADAEWLRLWCLSREERAYRVWSLHYTEYPLSDIWRSEGLERYQSGSRSIRSVHVVTGVSHAGAYLCCDGGTGPSVSIWDGADRDRRSGRQIIESEVAYCEWQAPKGHRGQMTRAQRDNPCRWWYLHGVRTLTEILLIPPSGHRHRRMGPLHLLPQEQQRPNSAARQDGLRLICASQR